MWKNVKDEISASQIISAGLSAGTAWALSNQIGLTGSVLGVVTGATVGSVLSSVYKHSIKDTQNAIAKKIPQGSKKTRKLDGEVETGATSEGNINPDEEAEVVGEVLANQSWIFKPYANIIVSVIISFAATILVILAFQAVIAGAEGSSYREIIIREPEVNNTTIIVTPTPEPTVTIFPEPEPQPTVTVTAEPEPAVTVTAEPEPQPTVTVTAEPEPVPSVNN